MATDDPNSPQRPSAVLLLAAAREISTRNPDLTQAEAEERASWLIGKKVIGIASDGALYMLPSGLEECRKAGLLVDGLGPRLDSKRPRDGREERLRDGERDLAARREVSRQPRPRLDRAAIERELAETFRANPGWGHLQKAKERERVNQEHLTAGGMMGGLGSNGVDS